MKRLAPVLAGIAGAALLAGAAAIAAGIYDISASGQHLRPIYLLLDYALKRSVARRAADIPVPDLGRVALIERGLALYDQHCVQCHGAPGIAPAPFALALRPAPANLAHTARSWPPAEVYWTVRHGVRMTGMPAWEYRLADGDLWAVVAFVMRLPDLAPADYPALLRAMRPHADEPAPPPRPPDRERGRRAMLNYACITCHRIPGVVGPAAPVGPPLDGIGSRAFIAGILPNDPENMVRWLRSPQEVDAASAMPDLGVGEQDASDMAAYLATLK